MPIAGNPLCKLYLVSFAAHLSMDYNQSSMAGGSWVEVGTFSLRKCQIFASQVQTSGDDLGPGNTKVAVKAVYIPISTDNQPD